MGLIKYFVYFRSAVYVAEIVPQGAILWFTRFGERFQCWGRRFLQF